MNKQTIKSTTSPSMMKREHDEQQNPVPVWLSGLLMIAVGLSFLTVFVSGYIRLVESGLGCHDWPACFGYYHYNESAQGINVLFEQGEQSPHRMARVAHRLVTSVLGFIILFIFFIAWRQIYRLGKVVPTLLLILTLILASIGSIHPVQPLPLLTLANFLGGLLLVVLTFYLYQSVVVKYREKVITPYSYLVRIGMAVVVIQVMVGGWTSANYAGNSCKGLFDCQMAKQLSKGDQQSFFSFKALVLDENKRVIMEDKMPAIQQIHHILAALALLYFIFLTMLFMRNERKLQNDCMVVLALLIMQCLSGLTALAFELPLLVIVGHNLLAALLLAFTTSLNIKATSRV